jgi:DNA repair photolyase
LKAGKGIEVGFPVTTGDEAVRKLFEAGASLIQERIDALETLHKAGIRRLQPLIAPLLPGGVDCVERLAGKVDYRPDRQALNYPHADNIFKKHGMGACHDGGVVFREKGRAYAEFYRQGVEA